MSRLNPEIRSGFLVTASLAVLIFFLFAAGGSALLKGDYEVDILFNYVSGLAKNAPVHFAGHEVGQVSRVEIRGEKDGQIQVTASLSKEVVLRKDSEAFIDMLGFMGEKYLELTPGSPDAAPLGADEPLRGTDPIALDKMMKEGTEAAEELKKTTVTLRELIENLNELVGENRRKLNSTFENLNEASQNLKEMTQDLKLHPWKLLKKEKASGEGKRRFFLF